MEPLFRLRPVCTALVHLFRVSDKKAHTALQWVAADLLRARAVEPVYHLSHRIRLDPTDAQRHYFAQCARTARFVWNWAVKASMELYRKGQRPNMDALKKVFLAKEKPHLLWLHEVQRDAYHQPFRDMAKTWSKFYKDVAKGYAPEPLDYEARRALKAKGSSCSA